MDAREIIEFIANSPKKTPVKVYLKKEPDFDCSPAQVYGNVIFGDFADILPILENNGISLEECLVENSTRNSAVPLLDMKFLKARIEPGAIIREHVTIEDNAVIMMGAVVNIGAHVGKGSMIDMNAVLGGRAIVKNNCHIGAGAVLAGVNEPASATPVVIEDDVMIGANAVVLEGVHVGKGAVIAAGAVVTEDIPDNAVAAGIPARVVKMKDEQTTMKTALEQSLRSLD